MKLRLLAAVLALATVWNPATATGLQATPTHNAVHALYVANAGSDTVSVIDTMTNAVSSTAAVGAEPLELAVTPDGAFLYVLNIGGHSVSVVSTADDVEVATVEVDDPTGVAFTPDGAYALITSQSLHSVAVIDTTSREVVNHVAVGFSPQDIAVTPDGQRAFVTNAGDNTVSVVDVPGQAVVGLIELDQPPSVVDLSPDGSLAYIGIQTGTVTVVEVDSLAVVATIPVGQNPYGLTHSPDGSRLYVSAYSSHTVSVIDTGTHDVLTTIGGFSGPMGIAVRHDGAFVYVANSDTDQVSVIDAGTNTVVDSITVGTSPWGVVMAPAADAEIAIEIDIRPGGGQNSINLKARGRIPVAILSQPSFDPVTDVDRSSLRFGRTGTESSLASCPSGRQDVNRDGQADLVCHFEVARAGFTLGVVEGVLTGQTLAGAAFAGRDSIQIR